MAQSVALLEDEADRMCVCVCVFCPPNDTGLHAHGTGCVHQMYIGMDKATRDTYIKAKQ